MMLAGAIDTLRSAPFVEGHHAGRRRLRFFFFLGRAFLAVAVAPWSSGSTRDAALSGSGL